MSSAKGRKIAVLGGMLELGDFAPQAHFEVGVAASEKSDLLFDYGANSEEYVRGAKIVAKSFATHEELAEALQKELKAGDTVLVKGSRGMRMERVLQLCQLHIEGEK